MKKTILCVAMLALLVSAPAAFAGDLGLYGSYWDTDALGETGGAGAKFAFGDGPVQFELRATYYPDISEEIGQLIDDGTGDFELEATVPELGVTFDFGPSDSFRPYAGGGVSYYLLSTNRFDTEDEVGFYGVLGAEFGPDSGRVGFYVEGAYRWVEATVKNEDDIDEIDLADEVKIDLNGPTVNAGVVFRF